MLRRNENIEHCYFSTRELVTVANRLKINLTLRKVNYRAGLGLLPPPIQVKSEHGKPTNLYPQEALGAAAALERWYRIVKDPEKAKIWLWLEGFDYTGIEPAEIVRGFAQELWCYFKSWLPSLPALESVRPDPELLYATLGETERNIPDKEYPGLGLLAPLICNLLTDEEIEKFDNPRSFEEETALGLMCGLSNSRLKGLGPLYRFLKGGIVDDPRLIANFGPPSLVKRLPYVDWDFVRALWLGINIVCDVKKELSPWFVPVLLRKIRRLAYSRFGPEAVLSALALTSVLSPEEAKQRFLCELGRNRPLAPLRKPLNVAAPSSIPEQGLHNAPAN